MTSEYPGTQPAAEAETDSRIPRRSTVLISLALTLFIFVATMLLMLYYGFARPEPRGSITVRGNSQWLGATVSLTAANQREPLHAVHLGSAESHSVTFFLPAGQYALEVGFDGARVLVRREIKVDESGEQQIQLPESPTTIPASTSPAR